MESMTWNEIYTNSIEIHILHRNTCQWWELKVCFRTLVLTLVSTSRLCHHSGMTKDGYARHFFYPPTKTYNVGEKRKVAIGLDSKSSRAGWCKSGKTLIVNDLNKKQVPLTSTYLSSTCLWQHLTLCHHQCLLLRLRLRLRQQVCRQLSDIWKMEPLSKLFFQR